MSHKVTKSPVGAEPPSLPAAQPVDVGLVSHLLARVAPERVLGAYLGRRERPDGRRFDEVRERSGTSRSGENFTVGSAMATVGDSRALATVSLEAKQAEDPTISFEVRSGTTQWDATMCRIVERLLGDLYAGVTLPEALARLPLRLVVVVAGVTDNGGLLDAVVTVTTTALRATRVPQCTLDVDTVHVVDGDLLALDLNVLPLALPFAIVPHGDDPVVLTDPSPPEERLATLVTVVCGYTPGRRPKNIKKRHRDDDTVSSSTTPLLLLKLLQLPGGPCPTTPALLRDCVTTALRHLPSFVPTSGDVVEP